jgi:hypothetical protein
MGARINFVFKTNLDEPYLVLYSHWGETEWRKDLAQALDFARPRWTDDSYCLRIIIDQLTKDARDSETGYGLFLAKQNELDFLDYPVIIDTQAQWVQDEGGQHSWNSFIEYQNELVEYHNPIPVEINDYVGN